MTRLFVAALAAVCLSGLVQAQGPIQGEVAPGGCGGCAQAAAMGGRYAGDARYGLNPFFKRLMFWKRDASCGNCGVGVRGFMGNCLGGNCAGQPGGGYGYGRGHGNGADAFNPYPDGVPGTLVFPHNPYIRSPRDWYHNER